MKVYGELQRCLDERVSVEAQAVEAAMLMAKECIEDQSLIEYEWKIQVRHETYTSMEYATSSKASQYRSCTLQPPPPQMRHTSDG